MKGMKFDNIKGVIFDYGGTLDSGGDHWSEVIWKAWQAAGVPSTKEDFREAYVWTERELAKTRHILPEHNFLDLLRIKMRLELEELARIYERRIKAGETEGSLKQDEISLSELLERKSELAEETARYCYRSAREWIEKSRPVLEYLYKKYPMVLVSNFYGNVETVLSDFDLSRYFQKVIESAVVGVRKPDPAIFGLGVEALGLKPEEVLVVGDSLTKDILPSESLGCQTAWLKGKGWTKEEDMKEHPSRISSLEVLRESL